MGHNMIYSPFLVRSHCDMHPFCSLSSLSCSKYLQELKLSGTINCAFSLHVYKPIPVGEVVSSGEGLDIAAIQTEV